jgi:hypothetical protein
MFRRALVTWVGILVVASLNGAVRDLALAPRWGDPLARAVSTLSLCGLILLVTWLTIGWIHPVTTRGALAIGLLWLALTLAFEFLAGHYLFHKPWSVLLGDYDVRRGRVWAAALVVTFIAPLSLARARGLIPPSGRGSFGAPS